MMEHIPYACGRLGALAQDIRLRAGQLPALREAGGASDLRQIAQHMQKLVSGLREAALLLEELGLPKVSAYTAQLCSAVSGFHIRTADYSKLVSAFSDWLEYIKPLLPDAEAKTVTAAAVGRLMNNVRLGYYPTDPAHVAYVKRALRFPEGKTANLLDPCWTPAAARATRFICWAPAKTPRPTAQNWMTAVRKRRRNSWIMLRWEATITPAFRAVRSTCCS